MTGTGEEQVGVAGRTGCGKSTLMMALFRVMEAHSGSITIDGIDIRDIGLFDLRSRLALVPQVQIRMSILAYLGVSQTPISSWYCVFCDRQFACAHASLLARVYNMS